MTLSLGQIIRELEKIIPLRYQEKWDRSGLQVGEKSREVDRVLFALDPCNEVLREAVRKKCQLIVTHHPVSLSLPRYHTVYEKKLLKTARKNQIAIYSAHTSHDGSPVSLSRYYGVKLKLKNSRPLVKTARGKGGIGIFGRLPQAMSLLQVARQLKKILKIHTLRLVGPKQKKIRSVAICTGSGMSLLGRVLSLKADLFITGDVKYHYAVLAFRNNLALIDPGHFHSEKESVDLLKKIFKKSFGNRLKLIEYRKLKDPFIYV